MQFWSHFINDKTYAVFITFQQLALDKIFHIKDSQVEEGRPFRC